LELPELWTSQIDTFLIAMLNKNELWGFQGAQEPPELWRSEIYTFLNRMLNKTGLESSNVSGDTLGGIWYSRRELRDRGPRCSDRLTSN